MVNDNSFGIESLIKGVKSYQYDLNEPYPEDRLPEFDLYKHIVEKKDLLILRDEILDQTFSKKINNDYIKKYILNTYNIYNREKIDFFNQIK